MNKLFTLVILLAGFLLGSCTQSDNEEENFGSIYGVVTELGTAEPMKAMGVELYKSQKLLLKTVTYDDGHFEFINLAQGDYQVNVLADGYEQTEEGLVTVEGGRKARIDLQVKKIQAVPIVTTLAPTNVFAQSATLNGRIEADGTPSYTEHGFVYSKFFNRPTVDDPSDVTTKYPVKGHGNEFSANVSSLTENATYYVRAYAMYEGGTVYGEAISFTLSTLPIVTTLETTNVLPTSATLHGRIDNAGEPPYTERGFVYSSSYQIPAVGDPTSATIKVIVEGTSQEFHANISSLEKGYTYYVRAYATSRDGTSYGDVQTFKTEHPDYVIINNLMIQKEDLGVVDWDSAILLCKNSRVAGFSDWHLPTIDELSTIYNNRNDIPNLTLSAIYWSSSRRIDYHNFTYQTLDFQSGKVDEAYVTNSYSVRAVRTITKQQ